MEPAEQVQTEIRSQEVQEILGQAPRWITRWGITLIFSSLLLFLILSWFFKYPDVIQGAVTIVTTSPPASVVAKANGKIEKIFVENNATVKAGDLLAVLENSANHEDVFRIKAVAGQYLHAANAAAAVSPETANAYALGELQRPFSEFLKNHGDYTSFLALDHYTKQAESLLAQLEKLKAYHARLTAQELVLEKDMALADKQFARDSSLYKNKVTATADFEKSESAYLQKKYALEGARSAMANCEIQIAQAQRQIVEARLQYEGEKNRLELMLRESAGELMSSIATWEQLYILKAPLSGKITFTRFWAPNQNIKAGDNAFTIVPDGSGALVGKVLLPISGSGKVKVGQDVNIKLLNYPYMEYGIVKAKVKSVSLVPADNNYYLELELPEGLKSSYGNVLAFNQEMQGTAEIITDDLRLLERILSPVKYIFNR